MDNKTGAIRSGDPVAAQRQGVTPPANKPSIPDQTGTGGGLGAGAAGRGRGAEDSGLLGSDDKKLPTGPAALLESARRSAIESDARFREMDRILQAVRARNLQIQ